ncbi:MAG: hypothetical protein Q9195_002479 [Heterodermia aff. obscurata]
MDSLLPQLLSFPPHPSPIIPLPDAEVDRGLRRIVKLLNEVPAKKLTAGLSGGDGGDLLDILDPSINSLPYLYVLVAHINSVSSGKQPSGSKNTALLPGGRLWDPMLRFMEHFEPIQIRYGGAEFKRLVVAIEVAARKAAMVSNFITPSSGFTEKISSKDILQYFLLGGMIYTALKDWERAVHFYDMAIITPATNAVSKIQIEAYNKRLLVGVLWKGICLEMPRTTTTPAQRAYRATSKAYEAVAEIFQDSITKEKGPRQLILEIDAGQDIWQESSNVGLVKQVFTSFRRFSVLNLGKTYSSLPVADVARQTSPNPNDFSETANYLQWLISTGQLNASMIERGTNHQTWILKFNEELESMSEAQQLQELKKTEARIHDLSSRITESDQKIGLSKEYLEWCRKAEAKVKDEVPGIFQDLADDYIHDEDMMTDG